MDYESTVDCIKSCIVSVKGGLPITSLEADFKNVTGEALKPQNFGFPSLRDLLISIEEIYLQKNILTVKDEKTDHLSKLISMQKGATKLKGATKQKGATKHTAFKKPVTSRSFEWRVRSGIGMKRLAPRLLREREKKLEALKESRLLPSGTSAMTTENLKEFDEEARTVSQKESPMGNLQRDSNSPFGGSNMSLGEGSTSSLGTGSSLMNGQPIFRSVGRGRGRARSSPHSNGAPGGLSGNASPRRDTASPDVRSVVSESTSKGGGAFSTSSLSELSEGNDPILFNYQLIGEQFLTKVASLILGVEIEPSEMRLCSSSMDLACCKKRLKGSSLASDKVIVMLGLTDIMKGRDLDFIKLLMLELLNYLRNKTKETVIVTVPVPLCLKKMPKPLRTLLSYNEWLLTLKFPETRVVDILPYTQNKEKVTHDFLCDSSKLNGWNETACWALVEALLFSGIGEMSEK